MSKVIVISGAGSGFGALSARALAGNTVYAGIRETAGRNVDRVAEARKYAEEHGVDLRTVELDVSSQGSVDAGIASIIEESGRLDVVIHNAGRAADEERAAKYEGLYDGLLESVAGRLAEQDISVDRMAETNRTGLPASGAHEEAVVYEAARNRHGTIPSAIIRRIAQAKGRRPACAPERRSPGVTAGSGGTLEVREVSTVGRMRREEGYRLIAAHDDGGGEPVGAAGFRVYEMLAYGKILYVDDLVTAGDARSGGVGKALLGLLEREARRAGCTGLHLDSGVQRARAHRFYFREGMAIYNFHFAKAS